MKRDALVLFAAGSLRAVLTEVAAAFEARHGVRLVQTFGASGLLKARLAQGETADLFASANLAHPEALQRAGQAHAVLPFACNTLCVLAAPGFALGGATLVERLLDPAVRVGTSTPGADPAGDYAMALFDRIEAQGAGPAGAARALRRKALTLTGAADSPRPPAGRNLYAHVMTSGQAEVFITYATNAANARQQAPHLQCLALPPDLTEPVRYALALLGRPRPAAQAYADFLLGPEGQAVAARHGFQPPGNHGVTGP